MEESRAETADTFEDSPRGWSSRWTMEFKAARKRLEGWHTLGTKVVKRYLDERDGADKSKGKLNLFSANVNTVGAMLYGKTPTVDVSRKFADSQDDVARVAGEMLERCLNGDISRKGDNYAAALQHALKDFQLPGFGSIKLRYECGEIETTPGKPAIHSPHPMTGEMVQLAPEVPPVERKPNECVETDYVHWKDELWGVARYYEEVPWRAFRSQMTRDALKKRFGDKIGAVVPLNTKRSDRDKDRDGSADPWDRADVWEVWHKETRRVFWFVEGYPETLDDKEDPLELSGFFPGPRPLFANLSNDKLVPVPDYYLAQDLYLEVDEYSQRIKLLSEAVRAAGLYDKTSPDVPRLLSAGTGNVLIPVERWAMFAEKGGLKGQIDWLPLDMVVAALDKLRELRTESMGLLFQVTGLSDIMRGQAAAQTTATEQAIKAKFASVRIQSLQDEFARFASEAQEIKGEIMCRWFDAETIINRSNVMQTPDAQLAQQAVQLLQSDSEQYRIQVKPEAISLTDYAALKQEKSEVIQALGGYFQAMAPMIQGGMLPAEFVMQLAQWMVSGLKGASSMEGLFDQAIAKIEQAKQQAQAQPPQPPPPDPKMQTEQFKAQSQMQHTQAELHADLMRGQAETRNQMQAKEHEALTNVRELEASERIKAMHEIAKTPMPGPGVPQ